MRKIFVVTDPEFSNDVVLNRIREVPKDDTQFLIAHYVTPTNAKDGATFSAAVQEKKEWLQKLVEPLIKEGFTIETVVHAYGKLHETIIANATEFGADYIFKPLRHHSTLQRLLYTSTDWNLVRFCPCPILFVGNESSTRTKPILATLDLETRDQSHYDLNDRVLDRSKALAELIGAEVHIANAYNMVTVASGSTTLDPLQYEVIEGAKDEYYKKGLALAEKNKLDPNNVHLQEGAPELVVRHIADKIDAGIIVIGTMARSGFSGLFVGNTAERVLESANADVFVVKQKDFAPPARE